MKGIRQSLRISGRGRGGLRWQRFGFPKLLRGEEGMILRRQFLRSATSIGAQYREACRARSDAEFISKLESATQEIDETTYGLELLRDAHLCEAERLNPMIHEADELIRIFTTIIRKRKGL